MKTTMTPEIYESKRNDLISMLDSILTTATGLSATARRELEETAAKLKRNSFEIVLVGEFQGGKSTTFDTICDGREISPRGIGIKTSACKISAQSVPADQPERADLTWKSDVELMQTMIGIVRDNLVNDKDAYALFTKKDKNGIDVLPSLSDPRIHELASKAIHAEWERYNANMANYDPEQKGLLDLLLISTLILNFCNSPELAHLKAKPSVAIDELKSLVVFPQDWAARWLMGGEKAQWTFSEVPFVFLGSISCHIHCANLERLGCVITDCPGLFAGPWDTAVAQKAMMQADAILYLIGGQKAVTEADLRALTEIRKTQQGHKVFFAINARLSKANIAGPIRQADFSMIKQRGYEIDNAETIDVFNSLLAFDSKTTPADEKRWKKEVSAALAVYLGLDLTDDDDIKRAKELRENRPELYKASDFPSILAKIETDVVTKKFKSILVNGGTSKASAALDSLNGDLQQKEDSAKKSLSEVEVKVEQARKQLIEFQEFAKNSVVEMLSDDKAATLVSRDLWNEVYKKNADSIADAVAERITQKLLSSDGMMSTFMTVCAASLQKILGSERSQKHEQKLNAMIEKASKDAIDEITTPAMNGWMTNLKNGQNDTFAATYGIALERVAIAVQQKWDRDYQGGQTLLNGLSPAFDFTPETIDWGGDMSFGISDVRGQLGGIVFKHVAMIVAALVAGYFGPACLFTFIAGFTATGTLMVPILIVFAVGSAFSATILAMGRKFLRNMVIGRLKIPMRDKLKNALTEKEEEIVNIFKTHIVPSIIDALKVKCDNSLSKQNEAFSRRVNETLEMKRKGQSEQNRIAAEAKKVREEQIEPARKQIAEFHKGLEPFFEADSKQEA